MELETEACDVVLDPGLSIWTLDDYNRGSPAGHLSARNPEILGSSYLDTMYFDMMLHRDDVKI